MYFRDLKQIFFRRIQECESPNKPFIVKFQRAKSWDEFIPHLIKHKTYIRENNLLVGLWNQRLVDAGILSLYDKPKEEIVYNEEDYMI